jgi:hypothetical protein
MHGASIANVFDFALGTLATPFDLGARFTVFQCSQLIVDLMT